MGECKDTMKAAEPANTVKVGSFKDQAALDKADATYTLGQCLAVCRREIGVLADRKQVELIGEKSRQGYNRASLSNILTQMRLLDIVIGIGQMTGDVTLDDMKPETPAAKPIGLLPRLKDLVTPKEQVLDFGRALTLSLRKIEKLVFDQGPTVTPHAQHAMVMLNLIDTVMVLVADYGELSA